MASKKKTVVLALAGLFTAGSAAAQPFESGVGQYHSMTQLQPAEIKVEPFLITPWVGLGVGSNDNVGLSDTNRISSRYTVISPGVSAALKDGTQSYVAEYSGNYGRYSSSSVDDYNDHTVAFDADNSWTGRSRTHLRLDYLKGHDPRNALRLSAFPERWHATSARGAFRYGADGAQGQIEVEAGYGSKRYDTDLAITSFFERDQRALSGTFYYRLAPATHALVQLRDTHFSYVSALASAYSSTERHYLAGVKWDATAKTSGSFLVGSMKKTFDSGLLPSASGSTWELSVKWSPLSYSYVDASAMRIMNETTGSEYFILTRQETLAWHHDWTSRIRSTLEAGQGNDSFRGIAREDRRNSSGLKVSYGLERWLRLGVELQHQNRSSSNAVFSFTQSIKLVTLEASL